MKFYEKLIMLRKKSMLSQEQLAEKLNVTRQTISKWELDQSKPDMDKLKEISKLFEVDLETLTNDEITLDGASRNETAKKVPLKKSSGNRKLLLYIVILIFALSLVTLTYRVGSSIKIKYDKIKEEVKRKQQEAEDKIKAEKERQEQEQKEQEEEWNKSKFNSDLEFYQGTQGGTATGKQVDNVIKNNKTNNEHLIEVIFDGVSYGTDSEKIKEIKNSLKDFNGYRLQEYEISIDYDNNGYVNKVTIETK